MICETCSQVFKYYPKQSFKCTCRYCGGSLLPCEVKCLWAANSCPGYTPIGGE